MSDLISRQDAIDILTSAVERCKGIYGDLGGAVSGAREFIKSLPSAEPERKKGRWIDTDNYYQRWKCSECGCHTRDAEPNYCPNCGAKMEMRNDE